MRQASGPQRDLLREQERSRARIDTAVAAWARLSGATEFGPYVRKVHATNRDGAPVIVEVSMTTRPRP